MKKPKITKHTGIFQSMMENYKKNTDQTLIKKRLQNNLNSYFIKELYQVKNKEIFSDSEYFINEIKFENKLKSIIAEHKQNNDKIPQISNNKDFAHKITKDLFFYYKNQVNGRNKNIKNKKYNDYNINKRIKSPKSMHSISSAKKSYLSVRKSNDITLSLPLINAHNKKYQTPYKGYCKTIVDEDDYDKNIKSEKNNRIKYSGRKRITNYLNYEQNYFNNISEELLLKSMKHIPKNLLWRIKLPLVSNKIFNKVNEVSGISKNISRNINHLSEEGSITIENEKNRIKFMDNLMT